MASISVKVDPKTLPKIRDFLIEKDARERKATNETEVFRLQVNSGYIIGYTSGKIVATSQESHDLLKEALALTEGQQADQILIGSDEAGKGEWLGPLVVAAVAISPNSLAEIRSIGVMDSKELSVKRIIELAPQVKEFAITFKTVLISPKRFNQLFQEFKEKGRGLNDILAWAHCKAIESAYDNISKQEKQVRITIDEFDRVKTARCLGELEKLPNVAIVQKIRAEEDMEVACASILARAEKEKWLSEKSQELNRDLRLIGEKDAVKMEGGDELFKTSYLKYRG